MASECPEFSPSIEYPAQCTCKLHWNVHPQSAKTRFMINCTDHSIIKRTLTQAQNDIKDPCESYYPSRAWVKGEQRPDCVCGRPARVHLVSSIIKGSRKWEADQKGDKMVCGHFWGSMKQPGTCAVCEHKWIEHNATTRGLVIEAFSELHDANCRCLVSNDHACDCMSDAEKQKTLDEIERSGGKVVKSACKRFRSVTSGSTKCRHCEHDFYNHSLDARDGEDLFQNWRVGHMSDKELLEFFRELGSTREIRIATLKRMLTDSHFHFQRAHGAPNPNMDTIAALYEALTGIHQIFSPKDIEKIAESKASGTVTQQDLLPAGPLCYSCGDQPVEKTGDVCDDCIEYLDAHSVQAGSKSGSLSDGADLEDSVIGDAPSGGPAIVDPA